MLSPFFLLSLHSVESLTIFLTTFVERYSLYNLGFKAHDIRIIYSLLGINILLVISIFSLVLWLLRDFSKRKAVIESYKAEHILTLLLISALSVVIQFKFPTYHFIPVFSLCGFFLTYCFLYYAPTLPFQTAKLFGVSLFILLRIANLIISGKQSYYSSWTHRFLPILSSEKKIMHFSTSYRVPASAYFSNVHLIGSWAHYLTYDGILFSAEGEKKSGLIQELKENMLNNISAHRPDLLLVDRQGLHPFVDSLPEIFDVHPEPNYNELSQEFLEECCPGGTGANRFRVYLRKDLATALNLEDDR